MEYNSAMKNNEILPFAAKQMDLEIIILSQTEIELYGITYTWNFKNSTNKLIHKTKKDLNKLTVTKEKRDTRNKFLVNNFKI